MSRQRNLILFFKAANNNMQPNLKENTYHAEFLVLQLISYFTWKLFLIKCPWIYCYHSRLKILHSPKNYTQLKKHANGTRQRILNSQNDHLILLIQKTIKSNLNILNPLVTYIFLYINSILWIRFSTKYGDSSIRKWTFSS